MSAKKWRPVRGSNPRLPARQAGTLATELTEHKRSGVVWGVRCPVGELKTRCPGPSRRTRQSNEWSRLKVSNLRPHAPKARALPTELNRGENWRSVLDSNQRIAAERSRFSKPLPWATRPTLQKKTGAPGETRTPRNLCLRQGCLPIPSPGQKTWTHFGCARARCVPSDVVSRCTWRRPDAAHIATAAHTEDSRQRCARAHPKWGEGAQ